MLPKEKSKTEKIIIGVLIVAAYFMILLFLAHYYWCSEHDVKAIGQPFPVVLQVARDHMLGYPLELSPFPGKKVGVWAFLIAMIGLAYYMEQKKKERMAPGIEEGSADWNTNIRAYDRQYTDPKGKPNHKGNDNMILTNDIFLSMDGRQTMRNNNIVVVGGSGAGKSRFFVKPNVLQANASFVITDPSGELLESCGKFLEEKMGYKIKIFNLVQMNFSDHYNPFHYIRDDEGVMQMINCLITNTTPSGASKGDPFWEKSETALLMAISFYLYYEIRPEDRNLANVMKLLLKAQVKEDQEDFESVLDIMFEELEKKNPTHIAVRYYKIFKMGAGKTLKSILISAAVRLGTFNLKAVQNLTNFDSIHLESIGDEKTALFVVIPSADTTFNYLVSMMYSQLFETLYYHAENECKGKRLPHEVRFLLDEFANIGTIPDFEKKLATMRKYGISCSIILQNLAQLKTMYKDSWESITGNCDTFLFLGGQEQTTLEYVSKKLGKKTIITNGYSRSKGGQGSRSESENVKGRDLMTPDEISRMNNRNCILFIRGLRPFFSRKYDYPKHPNYKYTGDKDDKNLFEYRDPARFAQHPEGRKGTISVKREESPVIEKVSRRGHLERDSKDIVSKKSEDSTAERLRCMKSRSLTHENLKKDTGSDKLPGNAVSSIDGFASDYEFRDAENHKSDFLDENPPEKPNVDAAEIAENKEPSDTGPQDGYREVPEDKPGEDITGSSDEETVAEEPENEFSDETESEFPNETDEFRDEEDGGFSDDSDEEFEDENSDSEVSDAEFVEGDPASDEEPGNEGTGSDDFQDEFSIPDGFDDENT